MNFQRPLVLRVCSAASAAALLCLLTAAGYAGAAGVKASPDSLNFGTCVVGTKSVAETVTVTNGSRKNVKIESVSLSSSEYAYSGPVLPVTLGPSQSFSGSVLFFPTAAHAYHGRVTFEYADGDRLSVELSGTSTTAPGSDPPLAPIVPSKTTPTISSITSPPSGLTITSGQTATFSVTASGTAPLTYQWLLSGSPISGATSASYTTPTEATSNSGAQFSVVVSNPVGNVTSSSAILTVNAAAVAPSISTQPSSLTITSGQTATFSVTASGTAPLTYQWLLSGSPISGATSASYTTPTEAASSSGAGFSVTVSNSAGNVTSSSALLTVDAAPVAPSITTQPSSRTITSGQTATFAVVASGTAPLTYQWQLNASPVSGATSASYTTLAEATSNSAAQFLVVVSNSVGKAISNSATLTVNPAPVAPSITTQPVSQTVTSGQTATFAVVASGTAPLSYQWLSNGMPVLAAISATYTTPAATAVGSGTLFTVVVTNATGTATSTAATLTVNAPTVAITVSPISATVTAGNTLRLATNVAGTSNTAVMWTLSGAGCSGATCGSISSNGLYASPTSVPSPAIVTLTATSVADSTKSASASLTIAAAVSVLLTLSPMNAAVPTNGAQLFTANVSGSSNTAVTWSLNGTGCSGAACGTLATSLLSAVYTGPVVAPSPAAVSVVATSLADPTKSASADVAIEATTAVSVTPAIASVAVGATQQFSASVTGTSNTAVTWAVSGAGCSGAACGTISSGGLYTVPAALPSNATVIVTATSAADATKSASANVTLTSATPVVPPSLFGLTVLNFDALSPSMPFGTTRSWDAWPNLDWSDANPSAGVYNFTSLDTFIAMNQARGADIIYTFGRTPLWASSQPTAPGPYGLGECAPPANMASWDNYVTAVATHVVGRIKYWELWNEPEYGDFYCGDIPTMVTMAQHASRIIKGIDPTALILSPGTSGGLAGPAWLGTFLSDGAAASADVIAFHGYWSATAEDIGTLISSYKTTMAANGVATKPMWDTESSWAISADQTMPTIPQQVGFVAKDYLLHWSQGISRFVWYAYDGGIWGGFLTAANVESPAATSYGQVYRWMVGASLATPCSKDVTTGIWTCTLSRPGGYTAEVVWIPDPTETVAIAFPAPSQYTVYRNLAGSVFPIVNGYVVIGDQPILLETADLSN